MPVVPFGTGTSLEGNVVGNENGITISLEKMNKVLSVNNEDFDCRVQACVTKEQLNDGYLIYYACAGLRMLDDKLYSSSSFYILDKKY